MFSTLFGFQNHTTVSQSLSASPLFSLRCTGKQTLDFWGSQSSSTLISSVSSSEQQICTSTILPHDLKQMLISEEVFRLDGFAFKPKLPPQVFYYNNMYMYIDIRRDPMYRYISRCALNSPYPHSALSIEGSFSIMPSHTIPGNPSCLNYKQCKAATDR